MGGARRSTRDARRRPAPAPSPPSLPWWAPPALVAAIALVYLPSLGAGFVFDDVRNIVRDEAVRHGAIGALLRSPRPVTELTLAFNHALGGLEPAGYHAFNVVVHVAAALALLGLVRRSILLAAPPDGPLARAAPAIAFVAALAWAVHPLQTQSVTYVIQRAEAIAGLMYLLTLLLVVRGATATAGRRWWHAGAVACCAVGMGAKAVMVTAPVAVLLYDRCLLARSVPGALRARAGLYAGLAATWGVLVATGVVRRVFAPPPDARVTVGFGTEGVSPLEYLATQPGVILHYLRLALWPSTLCIDYAWPVARDAAAVAIPAAAVAILLGVVAWALVRRPPLGFAGAAFFLVLAPTSSIVPIKDLAFEHRMYLPLAAVVVLAVLGVRAALRVPRWSAAAAQRAGLGLAAVAVVALSARTVVRQRDYASDVTMWTSVVRARPDNVRARTNLAGLLRERGEPAGAVEHARAAVAVDPGHRPAQVNLGIALGDLERYEAALEAYAAAQAIRETGRVHFYRAVDLSKLGRDAESVAALESAVALDASLHVAWMRLGEARLDRGEPAAAVEAFAGAERARPGSFDAPFRRGLALATLGRQAEAVAAFESAVAADPGQPDAFWRLAQARGALGRHADALVAARAAVRLAPGHVGARVALAMSLHATGRFDEAIPEYRRALQADPGNEALRRLLRDAERRTAPR